jgi:hypothetical protein
MNYQFAEEKQTIVQIRPTLGALELVFMINGTIHRHDDGKLPAWFVVHSGRVAVQTRLGKKELGTARPGHPVMVAQTIHPGNRFSIELKLPLIASQLSALENHRDGGSLDFTVTLSGLSGVGQQPASNIEHQDVMVRAEQSAWIEQLNGSGAMHVILLEVAMPMTGASRERKAVFEHLRHAQQLFASGLYSECVAECRKAAEELQNGLSAVPWKNLPERNDREALSKDERLRTLIGTIHLYAHLAAHSVSRGGTWDYTRADAKMVLALFAAYVAHERES